MITVRFDASKERDMPWIFKASQPTMKLRIGETGLAFYEATNPTDQPVAGQASYNVTPDGAGGYFTKIACFCFTAQILQPHQTVQMPVTFYVDPDIVEVIHDYATHAGLKEVTITLRRAANQSHILQSWS